VLLQQMGSQCLIWPSYADGAFVPDVAQCSADLNALCESLLVYSGLQVHFMLMQGLETRGCRSCSISVRYRTSEATASALGGIAPRGCSCVCSHGSSPWLEAAASVPHPASVDGRMQQYAGILHGMCCARHVGNAFSCWIHTGMTRTASEFTLTLMIAAVNALSDGAFAILCSLRLRPGMHRTTSSAVKAGSGYRVGTDVSSEPKGSLH
jgi:hypothetical protein